MAVNITVIGLMIATEENDFRLYRKSEYSETITQDGNKTEQFIPSFFSITNLRHIVGYISNVPHDNAQFVIVYDASCANKEKHISNLLLEINKCERTNLLPILISVGQDQTQWNEDFTSQFSVIKEIERPGNCNNLLKNIVEQEVNAIKQELIAADNARECTEVPEVQPTQMQEENPPCMSNLSMLVLGGFIAVAGIAAVAIAFTVLFGVTGLAVGAIGVTAVLAVGLFAMHICKEKNTDTEMMLDCPPAL